jgi:glucose-fructose oxidoreductase
MKHARKIRYAVVGQGYISQIAVLPAFAHAHENSELVALVSDDKKKLEVLGRKYGVKTTVTYDHYEELLQSGDIDAVYIALPNTLHARYAIAAARAGIHVLCEKPMATSVHDCEAMIRAAEAHDVRLMIGYRLHFEETNLKALELVRSGRLGQVRLFSSVFATPVDDRNNIRLKRRLGGGTLFDIGIYCINAARTLFQAEPIMVQGSFVQGFAQRFSEVPEMSAAILHFPGERLATFTCSFGAADASSFQVVGTKGELHVSSAYELAEPMTHRVTIDGKTKVKTFPKRDQFAPELLYFSQCVLDGVDPEPAGDEGLSDVRVIEALHRSARTGQPVSLRRAQHPHGPSMSQEQRRPAVNPPRLVRARPPHS